VRLLPGVGRLRSSRRRGRRRKRRRRKMMIVVTRDGVGDGARPGLANGA